MRKTWHFTADVSDGKYHDGEHAGTVRASSEAEARAAVADSIREAGIRKGHRRPWTASNIQLT
ncbi:hypothetical protein AB0M68_03660 [Streptomyces sp. NPDC051453]|uniref:hypothetical protein n=1 Tax=Streptomyces sp. NPDC051453 TaxID=3154941 RepID=UPI0034484431